MAVMAGRPTDALWGIGARTAKKLAAAGITTVGQLARADPADLAGRFGPTMGPWYRAVALGAGGTEVSAEPYVARSRSRETTFQRDIVERADLDEQLVVLARRVAQDVAAEGRPAVRVGVKVLRPGLHPGPQPHPARPDGQHPGHHGIGADAAGPVRTGPPGAAAGSGARCGCWQCGLDSTGRDERRRQATTTAERLVPWRSASTEASGSSSQRPPSARYRKACAPGPSLTDTERVPLERRLKGCAKGSQPFQSPTTETCPTSSGRTNVILEPLLLSTSTIVARPPPAGADPPMRASLPEMTAALRRRSSRQVMGAGSRAHIGCRSGLRRPRAV